MNHQSNQSKTSSRAEYEGRVSNAIDIPNSPHHLLVREGSKFTQQIEDAKDMYDAATWRMYHRIMNGRKKKFDTAKRTCEDSVICNCQPLSLTSEKVKSANSTMYTSTDLSLQDICGKCEHTPATQASENTIQGEEIFEMDF
mmetsp:Transcript_28614/g.33258  ORF Transcript_28614/g.33258 Transcript_28614/m.33258 type:complete len:142 (+) Transcript_28614:111-536(+)